MKFWKTIMKNFKILFRRKTSLIAVVLGPLIIIALIGFAFNSSSQFEISIGYTAPDNSTLTQDFVHTLQEQYLTSQFNTKSECKSQLEQGLMHMCIFFPKDFKIENNKINNITFLVDKTRVNIVYSILNSVHEKIGVKSDQLSKDLTNTLISTLDSTSSDIDTNLGALIRLKKSVETTQDEVTSITTNLNGLDLASKNVDVDLSDDVNSISSLAKTISDKGIKVSKDGLVIVENLRSNTSNSTYLAELDNLESSLESLNKTSSEDYDDLSLKVKAMNAKIVDAIDGVNSLNNKISSAKTTVSSSISSLNKLKKDLSSIISDIDTIKQNMEKASQRISQIKVTSSEEIVNPIRTNIETISSDNNKLVILFPYVLLLVIMFVGIMLSSTLVMVEKKSKAYFRVFTTPTKDSFYLWTTFFTSFIILLVQVAIILILMRIFFMDLIVANLVVNLVLLFISISIFVMIGMAIGYLMSNQQGANMVSISVGAIFLFISNMVLPLESISPHLKNIANFNPYVLTSEMLRKSILFGKDFSSMFNDLMILLSYTIIIAMFIIIIQGIAKNSFFKNIPHIKSKKKEEENIFTIKGEVIESEKEFIEAIHKLNKEEFVLLVQKSKLAKKFIKNSLNHPDIAKVLKKLDKDSFLKRIVEKNEKIITDLTKNKSKTSS